MILLSTKQVVIRILIIISAVEFFIMMLLAIIPLEVDIYFEAIIDISLLAILSTPLIYYWVIHPFVNARDDAFSQIKKLAHTDPLTNLPNRRLLSNYFDKFIARTIRHNIVGAVLLMDLDGFKVINDTHGHEAGDKVLVEVASRIRSITRSEDVAARFGGDEFIILIQNLDENKQAAYKIATNVAEKLVSLVNKPIKHDGNLLNVGASIGIRIIGNERIGLENAIKEADTAMYNAKQTGKGKVVLFNNLSKQTK